MATWIFQANPDAFRIDDYLRKVRDITWTIRQKHFVDKIGVGHRVFLWRAKGSGDAPAGIVGAGYITREPRLEPEQAAAREFWVGRDDEPDLRAHIRVERYAESAKEVVKRDWLKDDPIASGLMILKMANATNYELDPAHARRLEALWRNTGRDWNEAESTAGLWAYAQTLGGEVSRLPDTPVAEVALKIGRAVTGVYNKVMNFRALDPRDARDGLSGGGASDKAVWARYFSQETNTLQTDQLAADYARLWGASQPQQLPDPDSQPERQTTARGQGYEPDSAVRRAVEQRAMHLAQAHYQANGYQVEITATKKPYDLRCLKDGLEIRVEVKGTRGDGSSVEMTIGEIENARGVDWRTDLFIVSEIEVLRDADAVEGVGGSQRVLEGWKPNMGDLSPTRFRVELPTTA